MGDEEKSSSPSDERENSISSDKETFLLSLDGVHKEVFEIAKKMMARHYFLNLKSLYLDCLRQLKDHGKNEIAQTINDLVRKKILVNGAAITREKVLNNQNRARILALIKLTPGIHFSKIMDVIQTDPRTLQWHLKMLEKFDFIREEHFGNKHVYFNFFLEKSHDTFYYYFQKEGCSDIFRAIRANEGISFSKLREILKLPRSTIARRIKMLIQVNLLEGVVVSGQLTSLKVHESCFPVLNDSLDRISNHDND